MDDLYDYVDFFKKICDNDSGGKKMNYIYSPHILQCMRFKHESMSGSPARNVMDYEFDFCVGCDREMWIDGKQYKIKKGSFIIRKPGQKVYTRGIYDCYMLTLDFFNHLPSPNYSRNTASKMQEQFVSEIWDILPTVFNPLHYDDYLRIFEDLLNISEIDINENPIALPRINELIHLMISDAYLDNFPISNKPETPISEVFSYIKNHYMEEIRLDDLAAVVHLNKNYLVRQFKKTFGISPISYLIKVRMDYAKKFLAESNLPIKTVATLCGYNDPSFFNSYFKKIHNISPAAYRRLQQTDAQ